MCWHGCAYFANCQWRGIPDMSPSLTSTAIEEPPIATGGSRDLRIDFFRGVALYMIFVDHVIGDPLSMVTYRILGLSDAAEIFVFLSGIACGTAYARILASEGMRGLIFATVKRSGRIYLYYVLSCIATIWAVKFAM